MNPQDPNNYPSAPAGPTPPQPPVPPIPPVQPPQPPVAAPAPASPSPVPITEPTPVAPLAPEVAPQEPPVTATPEVPPAVDPATAVPPPVASQPPIAATGAVVPPTPPVAGGPIGTAPQAFGTGPAVEPVKKSKLDKKQLTLIGLVVGGVALIGVGLWLVFGVLLATVPLEKYEGKTYSVLVPKEYTRDEAGTTISFDEPDKNTDEQSKVMVSSYEIKSMLDYMTRDKIIELYDETLSEKNITGSNFSADNKIVNFKKETIKYQDHDARMLTFEVTENDKKQGQGQMLVVFTEDAIYTVAVLVHVSDPSLARSSDKIIHSLKINE